VKIDQRLRSGTSSAGSFFETVVTFSHGGLPDESGGPAVSAPGPATPKSK
jgi:hypothetical protein